MLFVPFYDVNDEYVGVMRVRFAGPVGFCRLFIYGPGRGGESREAQKENDKKRERERQSDRANESALLAVTSASRHKGKRRGVKMDSYSDAPFPPTFCLAYNNKSAKERASKQASSK